MTATDPRRAFRAGAWALLFLATSGSGMHTLQHAAAEDSAQQVLEASSSGYQPGTSDGEVDRALVTRQERVSRSAALRPNRPAPVQPETVIEPITWAPPMRSYRITGEFGDRSYMWSNGVHTGLDFAAPTGTPIRSIAAGVVKQASYAGSYGYRTVVTLPNGGEVWYCHQDRLAVTTGQALKAGQLLGYVGTSGNVTGAHLHMEIRYGDTPVDPAEVLARKGVQIH